MDNYLSTFNPPQRAAVEYCDGPSLVIAGAGSGKTRVLTYKIAHLIAHGYEPWSILALTFTNKAANEMKERISAIIGTDMAKRLWMGTFHSVLLHILRAEHQYIGFSPRFTIYDTADSKSLVKSIVKEMGLDDKIYKPGDVLNVISAAKNRLITAEQYAATPAYAQADARHNKPAITQIYLRYAARCRQADAMDFDDILLYSYLLFDSQPEVRAKYEERFRYVLVDEYQDTNYAQHQIVWQLTEHRQRVCVVGDDAQSIYSFRGANIDNILTFTERYSGAKLFKLERNYRSTQNIVNAANSLIRCNRNQIPKDVFSENEEGEPLHVCRTQSDIEEARVVINKIRSLRRSDQCEYSDFAILYRTNAQSRTFEDALRKEGVPYRIFGGLSFYQRKEIKDIIAYYRLTVNPNDEEAFRRIVNYPARGIGDTTVGKIAQQANAHEVSLWSVVCNPLEYGLSLNRGVLAKLQSFRDMMESFFAMADTADASEVGKHIIRASGIMQDIYQDRSAENLARQENVEELINGLQDFVDTRTEEGNSATSLTDYLSEVSLVSDVDTDKGEDEHKVTLMTIHSAKGLEFDNVFVVGLEDGLFPSQMATESPRELEEERRLFYVAITRAKRRCYLTLAKARYRYGSMEFGSPSRFLSDINSRYLDHSSSTFSADKRAGDDIELPWARKRPRLSNAWQSESQSMSESMSKSMSSSESSSTSSSASASTTRRPYTLAAPKTEPMAIPGVPRYSRIAPSPNQSVPVAESGGINVGSLVEHDRFGRGVVEKLENQGGTVKATVAFEQCGTKALLLKFAKLRVIG